MCVVAIGWRAHPKWRLLAAGNRDELHARPSASLARWDDTPTIVAGRDLVSGGSWMGVSDAGRFAVVTNIRDAEGPSADKQSRGALVTDWLVQGSLPTAPDSFNPFSLIVIDPQSAQLVSNRPGPIHHFLPNDIHGLSNAIPEEHWPRKDRLIAGMGEWLNGPAANPETLLCLLADEATPNLDLLPIFIRSPVYGTRCSTVLAVDHAGFGRIIERSFDHNGAVSGERSLTFDWSQRLGSSEHDVL